MDTKGGKLWWGGDGGVLNWAIGIYMYKVMCIKLMTDFKKKLGRGNSLLVQWLGLHAFTAKGMGSIPGRGTKILQAVRHMAKK